MLFNRPTFLIRDVKRTFSIKTKKHSLKTVLSILSRALPPQEFVISPYCYPKLPSNPLQPLRIVLQVLHLQLYGRKSGT